MTPTELYATKPVKTDHDLSVLFGCHFNHMPEVYGGDYMHPPQNNERIDIRYYADHSYDSRRIWRLCSLWLDGKPFMIIQNAGREGDDHAMRFITDLGVYRQAVQYTQTLVPTNGDDKADDVDPDSEIEGLTDFYYDNLRSIVGAGG